MSNNVTYRKNRLKKIINEFTENNWELPNYKGKDIMNIVNNKKAYESYIDKVKQQRQREKERIKISMEVEEYKKKRNKKLDLEFKKALHKIYGQNTGKYYDRKEEIGLTLRDVRKGSKFVQNKVSNYFMDMLTEEIDYKDRRGVLKHRGAFFSNTAEEFGVEENLNEINELMKKDKNVLSNMSILMNHLYEKIIPLKYEEQTINGEVIPAEYNTQTARAPLSFFKDTSRKLLSKYKELLR